MELEVIPLHIQIDILRSRQFHLVALAVLHDNFLITMVDDDFDQQVFHLPELVERRDGRLHRTLLRHGNILITKTCGTTLLLHLLAHSVSDETIERIDDDRLVHSQAVRAIGDIGSTSNLVLDLGDALHDGIDRLASLHRVGDTLEHDVGLKLDEVGLVVGDILSELLRRMVASETVRVVTIWQEEHLHVHLLLQEHVGTSQGGMNTSGITIVEQHDIIGKAVQEANLVHTQCRSRVRHHVLDATLVHGDDIGISLHHKHTVLLGDGFLRLIESIEFSFLMINLAIRRVDILLVHALGTAIQHTTTERHHLATHTEPREDGTTGETVEVLSRLLVRGNQHTGRCQILRIIPLLDSSISERRPLIKGEAQLEFLDDVITESTASEILHTDGTTIDIILKDILEVFRRPLIDDEHRLTLTLSLLFLGTQFTFLDLDVIFLRQPAKGIGIGHLLQFHEEVDGIATLATSEAMADATSRRDGERRMGVVVERTQTDIVESSFLECHKLRYHLLYLGGIHDAVYGRSVYHFMNLYRVSLCFI